MVVIERKRRFWGRITFLVSNEENVDIIIWIIDYIDVNEYTKYLNELNEELDGNFLYEVLEIK